MQGSSRLPVVLLTEDRGGKDPGCTDLSLGAHLTRLMDARTVEEVWSLHLARMAGHGFDRLLYGFCRFACPTDGARAQDFILLTNHRREFLDAYLGRGHCSHEPTGAWVGANGGVCSWSRAGEAFAGLDARQRRSVSFLDSMGLTAGYTISFRDVAVRHHGTIGLAAAPHLDQTQVDELWAEHGEEIVLANHVMHLRILGLPTVPPKPILTRRQQEVLEWVSVGRTTAEIAGILGVTCATVEKHLRLAREVLGVATTAQAVLRATVNYHIFNSRE